MTKIVINRDYGGFGLSKEAFERYCDQTGQKPDEFYDHDIARDDPNLIAIVESMGDRANGLCAQLKVVEIPNDVQWQIQEYDGVEWIAEVHRTWS